MEESNWNEETQVLPAAYPLILTIREDTQFQRAQLVIRLVLMAAVGALFKSVGGVFMVLYFGLPTVAAVLIANRGGPRYLLQDGPRLKRALEWLLSVGAYLMWISDRLPLDSGQRSVRVMLHQSRPPTVGGAVQRLLSSIPLAVILLLLGVAASLTWFVAALLVLATTRYPKALQSFQVGVLAFSARFIAYHLSLVDTYPPFSLQTNHLGTRQ